MERGKLQGIFVGLGTGIDEEELIVVITTGFSKALGELLLQMVDNGTIGSNVFMEKSYTKKPFANLSAALNRCQKLKVKLERIPVIDPSRVPANSILNEFIGIN